MKIRKADKKDMKKIAEIMRTEFAKSPFKDKASMNAVLKSLNFYSQIGEIYVSEIGKKIVGVVVFKIEQYWEGPVVLVEDLAVKDDFKRQGTGKKLMDYVEAYAKKKKIKAISFATHKKSSAVKFYKKYKYKLEKNTVFMKKRLR